MFKKGEVSNPQGRIKGTKNKATREIKEAAKRILEDRLYVRDLKKRLRAGEAQSVEVLLYHYAYGKPIDRVAPVNPDGTALELGADTEEMIALVADIRILLGREEPIAPDPTKLIQ